MVKAEVTGEKTGRGTICRDAGNSLSGVSRCSVLCEIDKSGQLVCTRYRITFDKYKAIGYNMTMWKASLAKKHFVPIVRQGKSAA